MPKNDTPPANGAEIIYHTLEVTPDLWKNIPVEERTFFIAIGHIANEINTLQKLILGSDLTNKPTVIEGRAQLSQTMLLIRLFCLKAYSGFEYIRSIGEEKFFRPYRNDRDADILTSLNLLRDYFSKPNPIKYIRNKFVAHYDTETLKEVANQLTQHTGEIYSCEQQGNSIYYMSEELIFAAMLRQKPPFDKIGAALETLLDDVNSVARLLTDFAHGTMIVISKLYAGDLWSIKASASERVSLPNFTSINIPCLVDFSALSQSRL